MIRRVMALFLCILLIPMIGLSEDAPVIVTLSAEDEKPALGQEGLLEAHYINVDAADCILLRMGEETFLIDAGHRETAGDVLAYLANLGIEKLDYAFLTHYHNDHIGGYLEIFDKMPVGEILIPEGFEDFSSLLYDEMVALIADKKIPVTTLVDGVTMTFGDAELFFYQWQDERATMNNRSMILVARLGERSALFAADVENNGQKGLAEAHGEALQADIMKMPHHGLAAYMREFHAAVQPSLVTFSNAKSRIKATIELTEQRHVDWLLTTLGTIVTVTDGGDAWQVWQEAE